MQHSQRQAHRAAAACWYSEAKVPAPQERPLAPLAVATITITSLRSSQ